MGVNEPEDPVLDEMAAAITDGADVDWQAQLSHRSDLARRIAQLRALDSIRRAHREFAAGLGLSGVSEATVDMAAPATPLFSWGPLQVLEKLGEGSFGEVYRALDPALDREVALKLLRPAPAGGSRGTREFLAEARRLARIRHDNVLAIHGADEHDGRAGMWMDLVRGKSLSTLVAEQGPSGSQEAAVVGIAMCRALAALHASQLVHRDLKPANVLREAGGRIVLVDFGCALELDPASTQNAGLAGTPATMAPEVLLRTAPPGPAADIYSLGVMLYWLVSGQYPVEATTLDGMLDAHRRGARRPLRSVRPDLPADFVQIVERATAPRIEDRYASAGDFERDLLRHTGAVPQEAPARRRRPPRLVVPVTAALVLVAAGLGIWRALSAPLRVDAQLFRQTGSTAETLNDGARVQAGDHIFLEIEASRPVYVYVLDQDSLGKRFVLSSPEDGAALAARARHRLPVGTGSAPQSWVVTDNGGGETIAVLAARERLPELEADIQDYERVRRNEIVLRDRGIGGVTEETTQPVTELARRYAGHAWVWTIALHGEGRP